MKTENPTATIDYFAVELDAPFPHISILPVFLAYISLILDSVNKYLKMRGDIFIMLMKMQIFWILYFVLNFKWFVIKHKIHESGYV